MTTRLRVLAVTAIVVACMVGCEPSGQRLRTRIADPDGSYPLDVTLLDQTGLVTALEPMTGGNGSGLLLPEITPATDKSGFTLSWMGGACAHGAQLTFFEPEQGGYQIYLRGNRALFGSCPAIGLFRSVFIRLSSPIDPTTIVAAGEE